MTASAAFADLISPAEYREAAIGLSLADPLVPIRAFAAIDVLVVAGGTAAANGLALPLELTVMSPSCSRIGAPLYRHTFRHAVPALVSFVPREGGPHMLLLREVDHNQYWGALRIDVQGERLIQ